MFNISFIIAQIIGILAIVSYAFSLHQKTKSKVIIYRVISNVFYTFEYLFLGAFSGVGTNMVDVIQTFVFYQYAKNEKKIPLILVILYIIVNIIIGFFTYQNIFSLFPVILCIIGVYGIWQDNLKLNRILSIFLITMWMIYNFAVSAYINVCGNAFQLVLAIIAVYRFQDIKFLNKLFNKKNQNNVTGERNHVNNNGDITNN